MEITHNTIGVASERISGKPPEDLEIIILQINVKIRKENQLMGFTFEVPKPVSLEWSVGFNILK